MEVHSDALPLVLHLHLAAEAVAFGDVSHDGGHVQLLATNERTETDLDRKAAAVFALAEQLEADAHRPGGWPAGKPRAVAEVCRTQLLGYEDLHRLAQELFALVAEQRLGLGVHEKNAAGTVGDDDSV